MLNKGHKNLQQNSPEDQGCEFGSASGFAWIRINLSCWIKGGHKLPTKSKEFSCFEVLYVLF
jgi:hypothetical protein